MEEDRVDSNIPSSCSEQACMQADRPHLLHRCATALDSIAHKGYRRIEEHDGYVASLARALAFIAGPFLRPVEKLWLFCFVLIDRLILKAEKVLIFISPPLEPVFLKMDELAPLADSLPDKFDRAMDRLPGLIDIRLQVISSLKFIASSVMEAIAAAVKHNEQQAEGGKEEKKQDDDGDDNNDYELRAKGEEDLRQVEKNCKEILGALDRMGMVEKDADAGGGSGGGRGDGGKERVVESKSIGVIVKVKDPIMELFDEGWQLKPLNGKIVEYNKYI